VWIVTRGAVLVSGGGTKLQALLDSVYFREIPDFELVAVISSDEQAYAMTRAKTAGIPAYVVDPALFPTTSSYSMAVANKLKDMDVDLVILAGYRMPLGTVAAAFRNRVIGVYPSLIPAFEKVEGSVHRAVLERGVKITGATAYFATPEGGIGPIILQKAVEVRQDDDLDTLRSRVMEDAEWKLLPQAVTLYCQGRLEVRGSRVLIKED
jgi:phosphoribosylglycinamide formyltransferase-1